MSVQTGASDKVVAVIGTRLLCVAVSVCTIGIILLEHFMIRRAVYPASLDPIHNGHIDVALRAAKIFDEVILAIYDKPKKNVLFSVEERVKMAKQAFEGVTNISVAQYSVL